MSSPLASLAIFLGVAAICWWALFKAGRTGEIYYRGDIWSRKKNPVFFGITIALCVMFGVIAPISFIASEGWEIIGALRELLS